MEIFQIANLNNQSDYQKVMSIYRDAFPEQERQPETVLLERLNSEKEQLFVARQEGTIIFFAFLYHLAETRFILLDYLASEKKLRSQGLGTTFMTYIRNRLKEQNKTLLLEVEHPNFGDNLLQRKKRIDFYLRNGANLIDDIIHYIPPLSGQSEKVTEMALLTFPSTNVLNAELKAVVTQLLQEVYGQNTESESYQRFIRQF